MIKTCNQKSKTTNGFPILDFLKNNLLVIVTLVVQMIFAFQNFGIFNFLKLGIFRCAHILWTRHASSNLTLGRDSTPQITPHKHNGSFHKVLYVWMIAQVRKIVQVKCMCLNLNFLVSWWKTSSQEPVMIEQFCDLEHVSWPLFSRNPLLDDLFSPSVARYRHFQIFITL